jgi:hypothetical protein
VDATKLDQIEKFRLLAGLKTGYMIDADGENTYDFIDAMEQLERIKFLRENPQEEIFFTAAFMAEAQGLTSDDFNDYFEYQHDLEHEREQQRRKETEDSLPEYIRLVEHNKFREIEGKQYPDHYHFKFNRIVKGRTFEITCRMFRPRYGMLRLWYQWTDPATKKLQRHRLDFSSHYFVLPKWMPEWWNHRWNIDQKTIALSFAHAMTTACQTSFKNLVKPV